MPIRDVLLALTVIAIWAGNYAVSMIGLQDIPPFLYAALRFSISAVLLLPWLPKLTLQKFLHVSAFAIVLVVVHMAGMLLALKLGLNITTCALVAQLGVPFSCLLGVFVLGERIGKWRLLGLCLAFGGIYQVLGSPHIAGAERGFWVAMVAAFAWAVSNLQLKHLGKMPMIHTMGWTSLIATPILFAISYVFEGAPLPIMQAAPLQAYLALLYSGLGSTILGYGIWTALIHRHPVSHIAPFVLLMPLMTAALGIGLMGDPLTHELLLGGGLTLVGIALIVLRRPSTAV